MAAGLATQNMKPFLAIYSTFLQRAYDQVLHDIARPNLNVFIGIDRAGLVGADGETHQGVFDISFLRHIPNMVLMMPKDENEGQHMVKTAIEYDDGPIALRYPRGNGLGVDMDEEMKAITNWFLGSVTRRKRCNHFNIWYDDSNGIGSGRNVS